MATSVSSPYASPSRPDQGAEATAQEAGRRVPLWAAVLLSRLLVLAAGAASALLTQPVPGWERFDPARLGTSLGSVGNILGAYVVRWDAVGYIRVAQHGYTSASSTVLFPLYPLLIRIGTTIAGSPVLSGLLISLITFPVGLMLVHRLARDELGPRVADTTVLLLTFSPWSFVFTADYGASLLLACSAAAFYLAYRNHFLAASVAAAAATLTHAQGILLVAPLAIIYWRSRGRSSASRRLPSPRVLALTLPPVALAGLFLFMHSQGWGWLAPIANQNEVNAGRSFVGPPVLLLDSVKDTIIGLRETFDGTAPPTGGLSLGFQNSIYLVVLVVTLVALRSTWRRLPREHAVFGGLAIVMCTWSAVNMEPLKGFDRYMLPIFPLWIGAAAWVTERRVTRAVLTISTVMLVINTFQFTRWVSVF